MNSVKQKIASRGKLCHKQPYDNQHASDGNIHRDDDKFHFAAHRGWRRLIARTKKLCVVVLHPFEPKKEHQAEHEQQQQNGHLHQNHLPDTTAIIPQALIRRQKVDGDKRAVCAADGAQGSSGQVKYAAHVASEPYGLNESNQEDGEVAAQKFKNIKNQ